MAKKRRSLAITLESIPKTVEISQLAEDAGFESVWTYDTPTADAIVRCTAIALGTKRIKMGPGVAQAFALGFSLAAPFVIAGFAYNVALGAINRAMPQLMVAFVGAPAITAAGLLILMLAAPVILDFWGLRLDRLIAHLLAMPR